MTTFAGRWLTSFGPMELQQVNGDVKGAYYFNGMQSRIEGKMHDGKLLFRYQDVSGAGEGWFEMTPAGQFRGQYRLQGASNWGPWTGQREWAGIWETNFGRMRLNQNGDTVTGLYEGSTSGRIEGHVEGGKLVFHYIEANSGGEGWFELDPSHNSFKGAWRPQGGVQWGEWSGNRVFAQQGLTWLVVIEAHWQRSLGEAEYSYGEMLRAFFARVPNLAVRQRYFNDGPSLERWLRELIFIPEPAVVLISSHGTQEGVGVHNHRINPKVIVDCLREAGNVQLLHFATCLVCKEDNPGDFARRIGAAAPFPISGYTTAVDWGGSAVLEFNYFDLMFSKQMLPEQAAETMRKMIAWAGDVAPPGSPYGAAGFRFFKPVSTAS